MSKGLASPISVVMNQATGRDATRRSRCFAQLRETFTHSLIVDSETALPKVNSDSRQQGRNTVTYPVARPNKAIRKLLSRWKGRGTWWYRLGGIALITTILGYTGETGGII